MSENDVLNNDGEQKRIDIQAVFHGFGKNSSVVGKFNSFYTKKNAKSYTQNIEVFRMMCFTPIFKAPQVIHIAKFR